MPTGLNAAAPSISTQPQARTVVEGANYTFSVTAGGTAPLAYQWRRDNVALPGKTASSLPLTAIQTNDAGLYTVVITNVAGAITSAPARLTVRLASDPLYPMPQGGWAYLFEGNAAAGNLASALDGSWDHSTDNWAGDGRGASVPPAGGIDVTNGVLTIEDAVATGTGFNNRRLYLTHNLTNEPTVTNATTLLNDGVTLTFRARLTPTTDPLVEITNAPNGLVNNSDGKGMLGIRQAGGGGMILGFSLHQTVEDLSASTSFTFAQAGLHMNNLNGDTRAAAVDPGEGGLTNLLALEPSVFHEFWITIQENGTEPGTHRVSIYLDGGQTPTVFNVTAGVGTDGPATNYLALGMGSSAQRGAFDLDFLGYRPGVVPPSAFNQPLSFTSQPTNAFVAAGQLASFSVGVRGTPPYTLQWYRNDSALPGATNATYFTGPVVAGDEGARFNVVATSDAGSITSSPPAVLHLLTVPVITSPPQNLTITNGDTATFSVTASTAGSLSYQWRFNGGNLLQQTNASLVLSNAGPAQAGGYDVVVSNASGSVTSTPAVLVIVLFDFGDAAGYPTVKTDNGARHRIVAGVRLGTTIDGELDGRPDLAAMGDDADGSDDEDGVTWLGPLRVGRSVGVDVVASTNGFLNVWVDFDRNGSWAEVGEQVSTNLALVSGTNRLNVAVPVAASLGNSYARFRFSTSTGLSFTGSAPDGEVEDYPVTLVAVADLAAALSDAPDPVATSSNLTYLITLTNAGPSLAADVTLNDTLPAGVTFLSALPTQGSCSENGGIVTCQLSTMAPGTAASITLVVAPTTAGSVTNTVSVSSADFDPTVPNNTASVGTLVLTPPSITGQPQSQSVTNGGVATIRVTAAGASPLSYQWLADGVALAGATSSTLTISNVQLAASGSYTVRITNLVGAITSDAAVLTVLVSPAILTQPQSLTNLAGSTAIFSTVATGTVPLGYQWWFNGTNALPGATQPTLTLPGIDLTNAGTYRVVVSNAAGVATSVLATLTVFRMDFGDAPPAYPTALADDGARHRLVPGVRLGSAADAENDAITDPPGFGDDGNGVDDEDGVLFTTPLRVGQSASVSVLASTNGILNAWLDFGRDGSWGEPGDQIFTNRNLTTGTNTLTFLVPAGANPGFTYARFRFSTAAGLSPQGEAANGEVEDYEVTIETLAELGISKVDAPDPIAVGSNAVYVVTVTNSGPALATGVTLVEALPPGVTFLSASSSQGGCSTFAGTVLCSVGLLNPGASVTVTVTIVPTVEGSMTNTVTLSANEVDLNPSNNSVKKITLALAPPQITSQPQSQTVSNGGTVTLSVSATGPSLRYQWRRDTTDLAGATNSVLTMTNLQLANEGLYTVRISNLVGTVISSAAFVSVLTPILISAQPQSQTIIAGQSATFSVTATGSSPLAYHWDRDAVEMPGELASTLVLPFVQTNQAGTYRVRVSNSLGSVTSLTATLTVVVPPSFTLQPESQTNFAGATVTLAAAAQGTLPLGYQWFFRTNRLVNQTNALLLLTNVQATQAGSYSIVASNIAGQATSVVAVLTVYELDFGDAPESIGYPTTLAFNGARHRVLPGVRLGLLVDAEIDALPNASATGDDTGGSDDEDGVVFLQPLVLGQIVNAQVVASTNGLLSAWIDFNGNGTWAEPVEQVLLNVPLVAGTNIVPVPIASSAVSATFARFRFSTSPNLSYDGFAPDGEIEDYAVTIQPGADLRATVTHNLNPVPVTSNVVLTVTIQNFGPAVATGVVVSNTVGTSMTVLTATPSQGTCNNVGGRIVCNLGNLTVNGSATISMTARANSPGTALTTVRVSGNEGDGDPSNNLVTHATPVVSPTVAFSNPANLIIADATTTSPGLASSYPSTIQVSGLGGTVYSVNVTLNGVNHGFVSDLDVLLVGPGGQSVMLMSDCGGNSVISGATLTFDDLASLPLPSGGTISPGTYRPSNYDLADFVPAPAPPGPYESLLSVFAGTDPNGVWSLYVIDDFSSDTGTISSGWRLNITTLDPIADLTVTAMDLPDPVAVGSNLVYSVSVNNLGPAAANGVRLTNALPAGVTFVSALATQGTCSLQPEGLLCDLGTIAPSATVVATVTVTPTLSGALTNSISVGASGLDLVPGNNAIRASTTARLATDVLLAQTASTNLLLVGQQVTYTLSLTNRGPNPATNVRLTDPVPANATFVSVTNSLGSCSNVAGTVFCEFGNLAINGNARVILLLTANASGSMANTATVVSDEIEANAGNNTVTVVTAVGLLADLGLSTLAVADPVPLGSPLTYTTIVTNIGPLTATSVQVTNVLPPGTTYVNASATQGTCNNAGGTVVCNLGNLANGGQATVFLTIIPTAVGGLTNSVGVSAASVDLAPGNNLAANVTSVQAPPAITTPPQNQTVPVGSNVVLSVTATGNAPLTYQWLFNATNLPGATTPTLALNSVTPASAGPYRVRVSNAVGSITSVVATVIVLSPPVIADVADQQTDEDTPIAALSVTVGDADSPAAGLELTALSSNPGLVPVTNFVFGGSASNRTVRITPARDQIGSTTITLRVRDNDNLTATDTFVLNVRAVNDPPTLVDVVNQSSPEDEVAVISLTIGDVDNLPSDLTVTATSSEPALVAPGGLAVTGTGTNRTLTLQPATNAVGATTITVTVTDTNGAAANDTFVFTVTPVNDPPTLAQPANVFVVEGSGPRVVTLTGISAGPTNEIQTLTVSAQSSDLALLPHPTVTYSSPATNGTLTFTPVPGASGAVTINVTVDDGGANNRSVTRPFVVTINATNRLPIISGLVDVSAGEDALTAISFSVQDAESSPSNLLVRARSSNPSVVTDGSLTLSGEGTNRTLTVQPVAEQSGETLITVSVSDPDGGTNEQAFRLTVVSVNDPPTLALLGDLSLPPNAGPQTVGLSNITSGAANEVQTLSITAASSDPAIIPHPTVNYSSPSQVGSLVFAPVAGVDAVVMITVTVNDGGATNQTLIRTFNVAVSTVNSPPSIATIPPQVTLEDIVLDVPFFISDSNTPVANLSVTVSSSNTNLVPATNLVVLGTGAARTLRVVPATNQVGTTTLSLRVTDPPGAFDIKSFVLTVLPVTDPPSIGPIPDVVLNEDQSFGPLNIPLSSPEMDPAALTLTAVSLNTNLLPATGLVLSGTGPSRGLQITPAPDQFGTASLLLTVTDTNGSASDRLLLVTVNPVNDAPTMAAVADMTVAEDSGATSVPLSGIGPGAANELQTLTFSAVSSNPALIPNPSITYLHPQSTGTLVFTPLSNATGTATITVTLDDRQSVNATNARVFVVTVLPQNDPPQLSAIFGQSMLANSTRVLPFTVADDTTPLASLVLDITASDTNLFPAGSLVLGGTGVERTLTAKPATNRFGVAMLTLSARDANNLTATRVITMNVLAVNTAPQLSHLPAQSAVEDGASLTLSFVVQDLETPPADLVTTGTSSNPLLVQNTAIVFGGSGSNRTVTLTPSPDQNGTTTITVRVRDAGGLTSTDSFVLTVNALNDLPALSAIPAQTIDEDQILTVALAIADKETVPDSLVLSGSGSDTNLVPNGAITFLGTGANRLLSLTPGLHRSGTTTVGIMLSDGAAAVTNTFNLVVRPVNTPPTLNPLSNLALVEDAGPQTVNLSGIGSGAPDESQTLVVTVLSSNPALIPGPTVTYTSPNATGTLNFTITPNASGTALLTVTVNDGGSSNNVFSRTLTVTVGATNDRPVISDVGNQTTPEDTPLTLSFVVADSDTAPFLLSVTGTSTNTTLLANTNIVFNGDGTNRFVTLNPRPEQFGTTLITLAVTDGFGTATDTFLLTVTAVNDPPTLNPLSDVAYSGNVSSQTINLSGIGPGGVNESESLSVTASSSNTGIIPNPSVSYTSPNNTGSISFDPPNSANGSAVVTVTVNGAGGTSISRTFTAYIRANNNAAPTISGLSNQTINEDAVAGPINFTVGDSSTAANQLVVTAASSNTNLLPAAGVVLGGSGANRTLTLTPAPQRSGTAAVTVTVVDTAFGMATNILVLTVNSVNDLPSISTISDQVMNEDATLAVPFIVSDLETTSADLLVSAKSTNTTLLPNVNLVVGGSGTNRVLAITPVSDQTGTSLVTITVSDGTGGTTNRVFLVTVNGGNDPPAITPIPNQTLDEDSTTGPLAFTISDAETAAASLQVTAVSSNAALVPSASIQLGGTAGNRTIAITPLPEQSGTSLITVTVTDGGGLSTNTAFLLVVRAVNDAPTLDPINNLVLNPGADAQVVNLTGLSSGAASENQPLVVAAASSNPAVIPSPAVTYASPATTGSLLVRPVPGTNGSATITVTVNDGGATNYITTRTFTVTVRGAPRLTEIPEQILDEDTVSDPIAFTVTDVETAAGSLTLSAVSSDTNLVATTNLVLGGSGPNRTLSIRPSTNQFGHATIAVTVADGDGLTSTQSFELTVNPVNDAPTLGALAERTVTEDSGPTTVTLSGIGTGATNELQELIVTATSSMPTLLPDPTVTYSSPDTRGTLTLTPLLNANGTATVTVVVLDGFSPNGSVTQQFLVTVTASNHPPTLSTIGPVRTMEDTPVLVGFTLSDPDSLEGMTFTVNSSNPVLLPATSATVGGSGGNHALLLTPAADQHGSSTISLTVTDPGGASTNASFVLTVEPVNDPPALGPLADLSLAVNTSSGPLPVLLTDIDSDVASATLEATSSNPTLFPARSLVLAGAGANRTLTLTPATNQTGTALVRLTATDLGGAFSSRFFRVNVTLSTFPPIITAQPASRTVTAGATVVFTVLASGAGPLSYQWRRESQDLSGATDSTLTLANVQAADAGNYSVVVRNSAGAVTSASALLRVVEAPRITGIQRTSPNSVDVSFTTNPGAGYVVEYEDGLDTPSWTPLPVVSGDGTVRTLADPTATGPIRFYRVRVE